MGCCQCEQKVSVSFSGPLKIMMVEEAEGYASLTVTRADFSITARGDVMITLQAGTGIHLQIGYVDAAGNPAPVDGDVAWESSDTDIVKAETDKTDSTKCTLRTTGKTGQVQITATADADIGEGTRELITLCDVTVVPGEAVAGTISPVGEAFPVEPEPKKE